MSRLFLASTRPVSDFQDLRLPLSSPQFSLAEYLWTLPTVLCGFRRTEIPQAYSTLGEAGTLFRRVQRTVRVLIELSPVRLFEMKSLAVVAGDSPQDVTCPESPAEEIVDASEPPHTCSGFCR